MRHPRPALAPAVLLVLFMPLLSGCASPGSQPTPAAPFVPAAPDLGPLPPFTLTATLEDTQATLTVTLLGPTEAVVGWSIDFGDGERHDRAGLPPATFEHAYEPPANKHAPARHYRATLLLFDPRGQQESATANITLDPPPNQPPTGTFAPDRSAGPVPLLVRFPVQADDPDGEVSHWTLDPGDGTPPITGEGLPRHPVRHEYRHIGNHTATLTLIDDSQATTIIRRSIHAQPPDDTVVWTYDTETRTIALHDGSGKIIVQHDLQTNSCRPDCPRPIGLVATPHGAYVLTDHAQRAGHILVFQPTTGTARHNITVSHHPTTLVADDNGTIWVAHHDGRLARIRPDADHAEQMRLPLGNGSKALVPGDDGRSLYIAELGTAGKILRIDSETLRADPLPLLVPDLQAVAYDDKHRSLVAADANGRIILATTTLYGPVAVAIMTGNTDGHPAALACQAAGDDCVAAYDAPAGARIVTITAKAQATATVMPQMRNHTLPHGWRPGEIHLGPRATTVALAAHNASGFALIGAGGDLRVAAPYTGHAPTALVANQRQPRLVYHLDPGGTWAILDVEHGAVGHQADKALPGADGLALAYRARTLG